MADFGQGNFDRINKMDRMKDISESASLPCIMLILFILSKLLSYSTENDEEPKAPDQSFSAAAFAHFVSL